MLIKNISGATVPLGEVDRLRPFIPFASDDPETVKTKLRNLKNEILNIEEERKKQYTAQGMNYPTIRYEGSPMTLPTQPVPNIMQQYGLTPRK
jgi:benzoyl-CoA reductase/2-hydroxyglutaryl-CoA dehydratase subunit BcrC/BadD/HgdB